MNIETKTEIQVLNEKFTILHGKLLENKLYNLANELSKVYNEARTQSYFDGIEFIKKINNL